MSYLQLEPAKTDPKSPTPKAPAAKAPDAKETPRKDRVMQWLPPFGKDDAKIVYETPNRITGRNTPTTAACSSSRRRWTASGRSPPST